MGLEMVLNHRVILLIAAIVLFIITAILGFQWFGSSASVPDTLGVAAIGLACFTGAHLP